MPEKALQPKISIDVFKQEIAKTHQCLKDKILRDPSQGLQVATQLSETIDGIICSLFDYHFSGDLRKQISILAIGGYGRGTLAPYSDIDLCFLISETNDELNRTIREFLYDLWNLKFKLGYSVGTIDEIMDGCSDMVRRTAMLEKRLLCGAQSLYTDCLEKFLLFQKKTVVEFVRVKLKERDQRHYKSGDSRYLVEPNLKEGKGGLRDIHTMIWIGKYIYQTNDSFKLVKYGVFSKKDWRMIQKAERLFWAIRFLLHFETGSSCEKINFDVQAPLAQMLGYQNSGGLSAVERFMRHYFLAARKIGTLTDIFTLVLEEKEYFNSGQIENKQNIWRYFDTNNEGFALKENRLTFKPSISLKENPDKALEIFRLADHHNIEVHPEAKAFIRKNIRFFNHNFREQSEPYLIFRELLCRSNNAENILRQISEVGILGKLIPDFAKITCLMQFNMYHHYTVDEHLIRCVGVAHDIAKGKLVDEHPLTSKVIHLLDNKDILFLSVFVHDMAKGRPEDHSEEGKRIISWLAPKMGFSYTETQTIEWLVLYHLRMSDIAQKRDLSDPAVHKDFANFVQSSERLRLLLCLTVADIKGVGPGVWNGYKGALLRTLYTHTQEVLLGGYITDNRSVRVALKKQDYIQFLKQDTLTETTQFIIDSLPDSFWLGTELEVQNRCINLIHDKMLDESLAISMSSDEFTDATEIIIYTQDYAGMFTSITGALATSGVTVYDAKLFTDAHDYGLNIFKVRNVYGHAITDIAHLDRIKKRLGEVIKIQKTNFRPEKKKSSSKTLDTIKAVYTDISNMTVDNKGSKISTIIEVTAMNRNYLLYDIASTLYALNISVVSAHINTYGERAIDVFYIKDKFGMKINNPQFIQKLKEHILAAISAG